MNLAAQQTDDRIVVVSDPHLLAPQLTSPGSAAFSRLADGESKLVAHSDAIIDALADTIDAVKPRLLLLTGDLTYNGERASHDYLVERLRRIASKGVLPLVIPGNHDINNPKAKSFAGGEAQPAATVTRDEFARLYSEFGYGLPSTERDPASLSYSCRPLPGLMVLGIDSNRDRENLLTSRGDSVDRYINGGRVSPETVQWIARQTRLARRDGLKVIAMMHHHLVEHIDGQARLLPSHIVASHDSLTQALLDAGVHVVFTGHLHITDAANAFYTDTITDVAVGSLSTYPFPLRVVTLSADRSQADISTSFLSLPALEADGKRQAAKAVPGVVGLMVSKLWGRVERELPRLKPMLAQYGISADALPASAEAATALGLRHLSGPLTESLLAVTRGGETDERADSIVHDITEGVSSLIREVMPSRADLMIPFVLENVFPRFKPYLDSALRDRNRVGTPFESSTPDHRLKIKL